MVLRKGIPVDEIRYAPIGLLRSPFQEPAGMPLQAIAAGEIRGTVEVFSEYEEGLRDVEGFSHLTLLYHLHLIREGGLSVRPFLDDESRGVFATRSPRRPNAIGISTVRLIQVEGRVLSVEGLDVVDGKPLLDIKPYIPTFDDREGARIGWFEGKVDRVHHTRADDRFL